MQSVKIKDVKKGEFFVIKPDCVNEYGEVIQGSKVFIRGDYCRELRKYSAIRFNDICDERMFKGDKIVYIDFIF